MASTSEVYGDPAEHPQRESYWGNVNPVGPRAVYDEAKRYAESLVMAYHRAYRQPALVFIRKLWITAWVKPPNRRCPNG